jgi:MFS family permease
VSPVAEADGDGRAVIAWTTTLLLAAVLPQYLIGSLAVEMRSDFRFSDAELGAAVGISFALSAVMSPAAGRAVDWIGVRRGVVVSAALVTVSSVVMGAFANSAAAVIALMAVNGFAGGIGSPAYSALLAARVAPTRHGTAFGMLTSAPQMAAFAAGLALPLVAHPLDWRAALIAPAVLGLASLVALVRLGLPASAGRSRTNSPEARGLPRWVHTIAVSAALASAAGIGMRSFLVVFAVSIGFESSAAGFLLAATGLVAIVSRMAFGVLGDRRPGRPLYRAAGLMALCAVGFVLMALGGDVPVIIGAMLAGGLGWGWQAPVSLAVVTYNRGAAAAAVGVQMAGFFAGALVGPLVLGVFAERGSYTSAWVLCIGLAGAAAAVALLADRLRVAASATCRPGPTG